MANIRCVAGEHIYDDGKHSECPYCRKTSLKGKPSGDSTDFDLEPEEHTNASIGSNPTRVVWKQDQHSEDQPPVVGWLVVTAGPGRGSDLRIIPGINRIGRDHSMNLRLDFGDEGISRNEHASVIYDHLNKVFYIKHGSGQNPTYLNRKIVMEHKQLKVHDRILLSSTELLFVPL